MRWLAAWVGGLWVGGLWGVGVGCAGADGPVGVEVSGDAGDSGAEVLEADARPDAADPLIGDADASALGDDAWRADGDAAADSEAPADASDTTAALGPSDEVTEVDAAGEDVVELVGDDADLGAGEGEVEAVADASDAGQDEDSADLVDGGSGDAGPAEVVEASACRGEELGVWRDLSGNGFDGRLFDFDAAPEWAGSGTPADPYRLELPGTAEPRVVLGGGDALALLDGSVEVWARSDSATFANKMVYNYRNGAEFAGVVLISQDGQWKALATHDPALGRWPVVFAAPGHQLGVWQHVVLAWRRDGAMTRVAVYVDGVRTGQADLPGAVYYSSKGAPQVGGLNGGWGSFAGGLALVRVWPRGLADEEVAWLFNETSARFARAPREVAGVAPLAAPLVHLDATACP